MVGYRRPNNRKTVGQARNIPRGSHDVPQCVTPEGAQSVLVEGDPTRNGFELTEKIVPQLHVLDGWQ